MRVGAAHGKHISIIRPKDSGPDFTIIKASSVL